MEKHLTPMKAIRAKCLECSNGQAKEVRLCPVKNCPLYELRSGHIPWRKHDVKNHGVDDDFMNEPETDDNFTECED